MEYSILRRQFSIEFANFKAAKNMIDIFALGGRSTVKDVPSGLLELTQEPGTGRIIPDYIETPFAPIASKSLVDELAKIAYDKVEAFPVFLLNGKGKIIKERYSIINFLQVGNCIDADKSIYTVNSFRKKMFSTMRKIVIDEERIDKNMKIFRLQQFPRILIIDKVIGVELANQFTGIEIISIDHYNQEND